MRIGIFDSGLGGLAIAQAIINRLPEYDYLYLGDTKRVPYGDRSQETIRQFTEEALDYLFAHECHLVILACNTASAEALRRSQQEYLPARYPDRNVLGMIIPTAEAVFEQGTPSRVGVLATRSTVESGAYEREIRRLRPETEVVQVPAPLLVPLIENDGIRYAGPVLDDYVRALVEHGVDSVVLGCTHYVLLKGEVRGRAGVRVISQDEIVPEKTALYLARHPEHESKLGRGGSREYRVTDLTEGYRELAARMAGESVTLDLVELK